MTCAGSFVPFIARSRLGTQLGRRQPTISDGERWAAAVLASEPDYDEPGWIDAYAMAIGRCKPDLTPDAASALAREAFKLQGHMNPKVSAGLDVILGPYSPIL
jgi:hypothetical protein